MTNARPTLKLISVRFLGARLYARFRICDDSPRNLTILATDIAAREGVADAALHDPDRAEPVRRLHPQLDAGRALPRQGPLHGHDRRARYVGPDECARAEVVQPLASRA